jgi:hypothetical protein
MPNDSDFTALSEAVDLWADHITQVATDPTPDPIYNGRVFKVTKREPVETQTQFFIRAIREYREKRGIAR